MQDAQTYYVMLRELIPNDWILTQYFVLDGRRCSLRNAESLGMGRYTQLLGLSGISPNKFLVQVIHAMLEMS
jgi:hypothetical protein